MEFDIDLTPKLIASMATRPRVLGRYSVSDLYFIFSGKTTPEEYLNQRQREVEDMFKMWNGSAVHGQIQELLQRGYKEEKREYTSDGITVVGKADYIPSEKDGVPDEDEIWEFKSSDGLMTKSKPWHDHQTKMYCSMFGKRIGKIFQPVRGKKSLHLKCIGVVERDDAWFMQQMKKLQEFHVKVEALWKSQQLNITPLALTATV